jgi:hypothetical protein
MVVQIAALRNRRQERGQLRVVVLDRVELRGGTRFGRQRGRRHRTRRHANEKKNGCKDASHPPGFAARVDFLLRVQVPRCAEPKRERC